MSRHYTYNTLAEVRMWISNFEADRANWDRQDAETYRLLCQARREKEAEQRNVRRPA